MTMDQKKWVAKLGDQEVTISSGRFAEQASAAITITVGETVLLATAVVESKAREGMDYLPLLIDYEEKFYAAGKISGSRFVKREGRPSENAILTARLIDRPLRPLFPKSFRRDIQIVVTVLSLDEEHDPDVLGIIGASAALSLAPNAPFKGPVGAVRIGRIDGQFVVQPNKSQMLKSDLDLIVAGTKERVMMIEAGTNELPDQDMYEAIKLALESLQPIIQIQEEMMAGKDVAVTVEEEAFDAALNLVKNHLGSKITDVASDTDRTKRQLAYDQLLEQTQTELEGQLKQVDIAATIEKLYHKALRANILEREQRPDGRAITEVRPISCETGLLPRPHGSGLFTRGQTQVLSTVTLGGPGDVQLIDSMEEDAKKRYMHHYNFPPYSTGEVSPLRGAGRREIGHGALAERALLPMIPSEEDFPYTIRVVSEVLSSNGSTSMGATCGSTISLMDAGVPLKKPVSGIAMGLVTNEDASQFKVLTDLQGLEDFAGDMDFKIAGTVDGITAVQMDTKIAGLTLEIIEQTIKQAREGRLHIMNKMLEVIPKPNAELSKYAPRITTLHIDPAKIGELIGPGGKTINKIIDNAGGHDVTSIDIDDTGLVMITSTKPEMAAKAIEEVEGMTKEVEIGATYEGEVVDFVTQKDSGKEVGALVEIMPHRVGMVHISEIANTYVDKASDKISVGEKVKVKVLDVDTERGRIALSIKALQPANQEDQRPPRTGDRPNRFDDRGPREVGSAPFVGERRPPRPTKRPNFPRPGKEPESL